jgi:hypothetical protein
MGQPWYLHSVTSWRINACTVSRQLGGTGTAARGDRSVNDKASTRMNDERDKVKRVRKALLEKRRRSAIRYLGANDSFIRAVCTSTYILGLPPMCVL